MAKKIFVTCGIFFVAWHLLLGWLKLKKVLTISLISLLDLFLYFRLLNRSSNSYLDLWLLTLESWLLTLDSWLMTLDSGPLTLDSWILTLKSWLSTFFPQPVFSFVWQGGSNCPTRWFQFSDKAFPIVQQNLDIRAIETTLSGKLDHFRLQQGSSNSAAVLIVQINVKYNKLIIIIIIIIIN